MRIWPILLLSATAQADVLVDVRLNAHGEATARQLGITPADLAQRIRGRINELYRTAQVDNYLATFSDTTAFSARGLGVDYVSLPSSVVVGFAGTATPFCFIPVSLPSGSMCTFA